MSDTPSTTMPADLILGADFQDIVANTNKNTLEFHQRHNKLIELHHKINNFKTHDPELGGILRDLLDLILDLIGPVVTK